MEFMITTKEQEKSPSLAEIIGDPHEVDRELQQFRRDTLVLSERRANLLKRYPQRWIAIYQGKVRANAESLQQVLEKADALGLPREKLVVRFINRHPRSTAIRAG